MILKSKPPSRKPTTSRTKKGEIEKLQKRPPIPKLLSSHLGTLRIEKPLHSIVLELLRGETNHNLSYVGEVVPQLSDEVLNHLFTFEGYESTRQAFYDILKHFTFDNDKTTRSIAYQSIGFFNLEDSLDFLIERISSETEENPIHGIAIGICRIIRKNPSLKDKITKKLELLLTHKNEYIRVAVGIVFAKVETSDSFRLLWDALSKETDLGVLFSSILQIALADGEKVQKSIEDNFNNVAATIRNYIIQIPHDELNSGMLFQTFTEIIPHVKNIDGFVELLGDSVCKKLLSCDSRILANFHAFLGYMYLKSAYEKSFIEVEILGEKFRYFLAPEDFTSSGGCLGNAYAVSKRVPENLRSIIAYHEFIESKTSSHEQAIQAEIKAAKSLHLEAELREYWQQPGVMDEFREKYL